MAHQYKYISGKELIARVSDGFTIDNSQWIHSAPLWIADALGQLKIPMTLQYTTVALDVVDYKAQLPCDIKLVIAIEYNGTRLRRLGIFNNMSSEDLLRRNYNSNDGYELVGDGWITTTFPEGSIIVHYRRPPVEYDATLDVLIPKIPDDAYVIEAIKWYLIQSILFKGFKHPLFDLSANNEFTNPGMQWEKNKKRARNSVNVIDADEREEISKLIRKFIQNYDSHSEVFFSGTGGSGGQYGELTTMSSLTGNSMSTNTTTIIYNNIQKYTYTIINKNTVYIPASTHNLGNSVIPVFYLKVAGEYIKAEATFTVDLSGNITWDSETTVTDGLIVLI